MTQEEKDLLVKDLCARLPYGVIVNVDNGKYREDKILWPGLFNSDDLWDAKPYLRPMSSMTEDEMFNFHENGGTLTHYFKYDIDLNSLTISAIDWLNSHHFDYRGLIPMGLALEAPEDIYK